MNVFSNINYYYHQLVTSNFIVKSTEVTASVAFYSFQGLRSAAIFPAALLSSFILMLPIVPTIAMMGAIGVGCNIFSRTFSGLQTLDEIPTSLLQQVILNINSVVQNILGYTICALSHVAAIPLYIMMAGADYIEEIATRISQMAIDTLGIPVQLTLLGQRKLRSILDEWKDNALPEENRKGACEQILNFYNDSRPRLNQRHLYLDNYNLRDLPNIFHDKPFSNITCLWLSNNQFTVLPENIYNLPSTCMIDISRNRFSTEEIYQIVMTIHTQNYKGPEIIIGSSLTDVLGDITTTSTRMEVLPGGMVRLPAGVMVMNIELPAGAIVVVPGGMTALPEGRALLPDGMVLPEGRRLLEGEWIITLPPVGRMDVLEGGW